MKKCLMMFLAVCSLAMFVPAAAPAQTFTDCGSENSHTYIHLECATRFTKNYWNDICCNPNYTWDFRADYRRFSSDRIDILGKGWRNGVYGCRWAIVRGSDYSKYIYWHPDSAFTPGCGGV